MSIEHPYSSEAVAETIQEAFMAGVEAVNPYRLVKNRISRSEDKLVICEQEIDLNSCGRIVVIGAGKAGAKMAEGFEQGILACQGGQEILEKVSGLVNVPEGSVGQTEKIKINFARPQGVNAVTEAVIESTKRMLEMIAGLGPEDVLIDLVSGGGSALREDLEGELTLEQFLKAQKLLQRTDIKALNCVRKQCSKVKGGKLNSRTQAGLVIAMILSDVVGDPLEVIASGPWAENTSYPSDALKILEDLGAQTEAPEVYDFINKLCQRPVHSAKPASNVHQIIMANNSLALNAMAAFAERKNYTVVNCASNHVGDAKHVGQTLGNLALGMRVSKTKLKVPMLFLFGGETTVNLKPDVSMQKGGRNQELVLAALHSIWGFGLGRTVLFSLATDGEDGPTDAAGVIATAKCLKNATLAGVTPRAFLENNNSYPFWEAQGGLIKTGLTGTNVCDLWGFVILPDPERTRQTIKLKKN